MPDHRKQPRPQREPDDLARMQELQQCGVDPAAYVSAKMLERPGFELPGLQLATLNNRARINVARQMRWHPPAVEGENVVHFAGVPIPADRLCLNTLFCGAVGSGKTHAILTIIAQLLTKLVYLLFWDYKGEARRLPRIFPEAKVWTPRTAPWQVFQPPPGVDPMIFGGGVITELRIACDLRTETYPLLYSIWERILRGLRQGDPYPSFSDFRRVVHDEAEKNHRENLLTVERMLLSLEVIFGNNARVRYVPKDGQRYLLEAIDLVGQDPRTIRLFLGLHLNELLLKAQAQEHGTNLRAVEIIDEIAPLASINATRSLYGDLNGLQRFATMARFTETGLIMGAQNISQIDDFVKNVGTFGAFRQPSFEDAVDAARMLGLPPESAQELMRLPVGAAYLRSVGWEQPVLVQFPDI